MKRSDDGVHGRGPRVHMPGAMGPRRAFGRAPAAQDGQSLTEFALVLPFFMLLVIGIAAFGMAFERKIAVDNAARSGARFAIVFPNNWSNAGTPTTNTIQWWIMQEGASAGVANSDADISIQYMTASLSTGTVSECGHYSVSSGWVGDSGNTQKNCMQPDDIIKVTVKVPFKAQVPWLPNFFPNGIIIQSSSTMVEEQGCSGASSTYVPQPC